MTVPRAHTAGRKPSSIGPLGRDVVTFALALRAAGRQPKTIRTYCEAAVWLAQRIPHESWEDYSRHDIREHMSFLLDNHSPSYASNQHRALAQFFRWLSEEEGIPNPMKGMMPPTVPEKMVPLLSEDDLAKLLETCKEGRLVVNARDKAIFLVFASSGARLAEIAGLKVSDIDLELTSAIVCGKNRKQRIVRFSPEAAVAVSRYMKLRNGRNEVQLWLGQRGPLLANGIYQMFVRRGKLAGVRVHPHQLRHTFSHVWMANGGHPNDLMQLNGWSSPSMVNRYGASAAAERASKHYDAVMGK